MWKDARSRFFTLSKILPDTTSDLPTSPPEFPRLVWREFFLNRLSFLPHPHPASYFRNHRRTFTPGRKHSTNFLCLHFRALDSSMKIPKRRGRDEPSQPTDKATKTSTARATSTRTTTTSTATTSTATTSTATTSTTTTTPQRQDAEGKLGPESPFFCHLSKCIHPQLISQVCCD